MKVKEIWTLLGNINRIEEMRKEGIGNKVIAAVFQEKGIDVKEKDIDSFYDCVSTLSQKALKKADVKKVIKQFKEFEPPLSPVPVF